MHTALRILAGLVALECIFGFFAFISSGVTRPGQTENDKMKDVFFGWNAALLGVLALFGVAGLIIFAGTGSFIPSE